MDPFHHILFGRDCPPCPQLPPCNCQSNEQCITKTRSCNTCGTSQCVPLDNSATSSKKGVSPGAIAGAVIAIVAFVSVVMLAFLWYRRRQRLLRPAPNAALDGKVDTPARAEEVLNRPDPHNEKPEVPQPQQVQSVRVYGATSTTIDLDPESRGDSVAATNGHIPQRNSAHSNPFMDTQSIQSASTGTRSNVIPIALVPPGSVSMRTGPSSTQATSGSVPARPEHPDVDISLKSAGTQNQLTAGTGSDAPSTSSGVTANFRNSYMTTGSYASDLLNEAPVIVTPTRGTMKQVVGVVKAEVIHPPSSAGTASVYSSDQAGTPKLALPVANRPSVRSPLARNDAFGPMETMKEEQDHEIDPEGQELSVHHDPFTDEHSPYRSDAPSSPAAAPSPAATSATFGESEEQYWDPQSPRMPWTRDVERPSSSLTQAASIIDANIGTASRVHLGLNQLSPQKTTSGSPMLSAPPPSSEYPATPNSAPFSMRSQYRMTSAKLVSPSTATSEVMPAGGALERQQKRAFENLDPRLSQASVLSSTSTHADSILEGFHFVPPSPISDRPIRTPPRSPLAQQAFNDASSGNTSSSRPGAEPLPPPNRKVLGMSTGSQLSTMSNGLGSFPFQIDSGNGVGSEAASSPPSSFSSLGRQRASLDTLALTSDLSSYPLGFDRNEAMTNYPGRR
ncbi:hypothetical protein BC835DRAFT_1287896 [Cytidiella melzeri]|nr:hypothetical protein BC835DRAFT_1287896 [Cytidiella melzeri]